MEVNKQFQQKREKLLTERRIGKIKAVSAVGAENIKPMIVKNSCRSSRKFKKQQNLFKLHGQKT